MAEPAERLLSLAELAESLGVPVSTVYGWRVKHIGPPGFRVGKFVRYRREDVERWLAENADEREAM